jgi:hypothetical protein
MGKPQEVFALAWGLDRVFAVRILYYVFLCIFSLKDHREIVGRHIHRF